VNSSVQVLFKVSSKLSGSWKLRNLVMNRVMGLIDGRIITVIGRSVGNSVFKADISRLADAPSPGRAWSSVKFLIGLR
jgi:hypothetical protein